MKLHDRSYFEDDVIFNQWNHMILRILGLSLFSANKITGFVVFLGGRDFQPKRLHDSSYFGVDFSFNAWDSRIRRFLKMSLYGINGITGLYQFGGWRLISSNEIAWFFVYLGWRYFQPLRLKDLSYFGVDVICKWMRF